MCHNTHYGLGLRPVAYVLWLYLRYMHKSAHTKGVATHCVCRTKCVCKHPQMAYGHVLTAKAAKGVNT